MRISALVAGVRISAWVAVVVAHISVSELVAVGEVVQGDMMASHLLVVMVHAYYRNPRKPQTRCLEFCR